MDDQLANLYAAYELNEGTISDIKAFIEKYEHFLDQERRRITRILDEIDKIIQECEEWPRVPGAGHPGIEQKKLAKTKSAPSAEHQANGFKWGKKKSKAAAKGGDSLNVNGESRAMAPDQAPENGPFADDHIFQGGEKLGEHFEVLGPIDQGKFGQVVKCVDLRNKKKSYAAKISKNVAEEVENAKVEVQLLQKLQEPHPGDNEGQDCILQMIDHFMFDNRVIILAPTLGLNLYTY